MNMFQQWRKLAIRIQAAWKAVTNSPVDDVPIVVVTHLQVRPPWRDRLIDRVIRYTEANTQRPENVMAAAYCESGDPCAIWVVEQWSSLARHQREVGQEATGVVAALGKRALTKPGHQELWEVLEQHSREEQSPASDGQPLTILLFIDVKKQASDQFRTINHAAMPAFREEPGLIMFQLFRHRRQHNKFAIYKQFRNREAFQYHLRNPAIEPVISFLQHSIKKPPFETKYRHLIALAPGSTDGDRWLPG